MSSSKIDSSFIEKINSKAVKSNPDDLCADHVVRNGLLNQMRSTCASDLRMLSGFLSYNDLVDFVLDVFSKLYNYGSNSKSE